MTKTLNELLTEVRLLKRQLNKVEGILEDIISENLDKPTVTPSQTVYVKDEAIFNKVKALIVDHLVVSPSQVISTARFADDLGADSLDEVELEMLFEVEFGIEILHSSMEKVVTVQDAIDVIKKLLKS